MKYFIIIITVYVGLILSVYSSLPDIIEPIEGDFTEIDDGIYVASHGWHTGLIVPAKLIQSRIPELKTRFKDSPYIEFGWGDKGFYQAKEITSGLTLKAIFWPTEAVVHAVAVPKNPHLYFTTSRIEKLCLNRNEYSTLIRFIQSSFFKDKNNKIVKLKSGIYGDSQFYQAVGDYYLMNTCNKWTAKALKSAGMDISTTFKLTASSVMDFIAQTNKSLKSGLCPNT